MSRRVGLSPMMVQELSRALRDDPREGVAILLVEQNAAMALRLASRGYLLETGRCVAEGDTTRNCWRTTMSARSISECDACPPESPS